MVQRARKVSSEFIKTKFNLEVVNLLFDNFFFRSTSQDG